MNDIGPPVGLQVNPLETEPVVGVCGLRDATVGNKILTSAPDRRTAAHSITASSVLFFWFADHFSKLPMSNFDSVRRQLL